MKRWLVVTDREMPLRDFKGQFNAGQLPSAERYNVDEWIEVVVADAAGLWRLMCIDVVPA